MESEDHPPSWIDAPIWTGTPTACDASYVTVFKSVCFHPGFHLSILETKHFQNGAFSKVSAFEIVFGNSSFSSAFPGVFAGTIGTNA